jgi:hypothetical protein
VYVCRYRKMRLYALRPHAMSTCTWGLTGRASVFLGFFAFDLAQLIVHGPHVGIDAEGNIGAMNLRDDAREGACCTSAQAAADHVETRMRRGDDENTSPTDAPRAIPVLDSNDPLDAQQQSLVNALLLPHGVRLMNAKRNVAIELPYIMFDAQDALMRQVVEKGCQQIMMAERGGVVTTGKIAVVGGITINTCQGLSDYFMPLHFAVFNKQGEHLETILDNSSGRVCTTKM